MNLIRRALACAAALLCACAAPKPAPAPVEGDYRPMALSKALDLSNIGHRVRCAALYRGVEDLILDLPEGYEENWTRLVVADPADPETKVKNVVVSSKERKFLSSLRRGEPIELLALDVAPEEGFDEQASASAVLKVEKIRRKAAPHAAKAQAAASAPALEPAPEAVTYANSRDKEGILRLGPAAAFYLKDRGHEISGTFKRDGDDITFSLPNGRVAHAHVKGDYLTDPDGKEWFEAKP